MIGGKKFIPDCNETSLHSEDRGHHGTHPGVFWPEVAEERSVKRTTDTWDHHHHTRNGYGWTGHRGHSSLTNTGDEGVKKIKRSKGEERRVSKGWLVILGGGESDFQEQVRGHMDRIIMASRVIRIEE